MGRICRGKVRVPEIPGRYYDCYWSEVSFVPQVVRLTHILISLEFERDAAYTYSFSFVRSLPPSATTAVPASLQLMADALRSPSIFDFDPLLNLENVKAQSSHALYSLVKIFTDRGLSDWKAWQSANASVIRDFGKHRQLRQALPSKTLLP